MIRPAAPADLAAVAAVYAHYVRETVVTFDEVPPTEADWGAKARELAALGLPFLVAEVDGEVAGYAYVNRYRPKAAYRHTGEDSIYLAPGRTGLGLGSALLDALLTACEHTELRQLVAVIADSGSDASAALHRRFGFEPAGRLREVGFKHGRWIDTVLMQRALG
ncbi:GNAT family N-acetyltransferase [Streptacidiphilus neutrinimicus]|uniref:GNAT family N-acetyltransferase n=1 Tax=Streptacidiphilus neutrinimicus TaxID=105420 RepID=UPI0005AA72D2|nr:GNAT family N-acetyltransferase [Streptacidiphilus neutrinimicus]